MRKTLAQTFPDNAVRAPFREGRVDVMVNHTHLPCLFPQHGPGKKHNRAIVLEDWQADIVTSQPGTFLRGLFRSDGCVFVNHTGRYEYLCYDFTNLSQDILDLFCAACDWLGIEHRRYVKRVRVNRRESVELMRQHVGLKL